MSAVIAALAKAVGQLADPAVMRVLVKSVAITIVLFVGLGLILYGALAAGMEWFGIEQAGWVGAAAATVLALLAFWFLFRVVAVAVLQFFADEIVAAVEARHYPDRAGRARPLPFHRDLANSVRGMVRALGFNLLALPLALALAFTGVGPALVFLAVNAVLLGRELTDMAWLRHCEGALRANPVAPGQRHLLGAAVAVLMLVPLVNLLAPVIGAAAGTHLTMRRLAGR